VPAAQHRTDSSSAPRGDGSSRRPGLVGQVRGLTEPGAISLAPPNYGTRRTATTSAGSHPILHELTARTGTVAVTTRQKPRDPLPQGLRHEILDHARQPGPASKSPQQSHRDHSETSSYSIRAVQHWQCVRKARMAAAAAAAGTCTAKVHAVHNGRGESDEDQDEARSQESWGRVGGGQ